MKIILLVLACLLLSIPSFSKEREIITLNKRNTVTFRGVVDYTSVAKVQSELLAMSFILPKDEVIYLVMDTPGGSVDAGMELIDFIHGLPQKVKTITIFAASMGFNIVQNLDERLILPSGTLMSHRARLSGASGEIPGEFIVRIKFILRELTRMDRLAAKRMQISLRTYQNLIRDEYWVKGSDSVRHKASDRVILARCDKSFQGTQKVTLGTFFGIEVVGEMSNCPLITGVLSVSTENRGSKENIRKAYEAANLYKSDKKSFVSNYISSGILVFPSKN